jgi:dihydroneopterin aldolase
VTATIELLDLELRGFHGVLEEERRDGQAFLYDVWLDVPEPAGDDITLALDYREVVAIVREVSDAHAYRLLESLAAAIAEELLTRLPAAQVRVRVRKPEVRLALPVRHAGVTVTRP